jgi:hypothetical protein
MERLYLESAHLMYSVKGKRVPLESVVYFDRAWSQDVERGGYRESGNTRFQSFVSNFRLDGQTQPMVFRDLVASLGDTADGSQAGSVEGALIELQQPR